NDGGPGSRNRPSLLGGLRGLGPARLPHHAARGLLAARACSDDYTLTPRRSHRQDLSQPCPDRTHPIGDDLAAPARSLTPRAHAPVDVSIGVGTVPAVAVLETALAQPAPARIAVHRGQVSRIARAPHRAQRELAIQRRHRHVGTILGTDPAPE